MQRAVFIHHGGTWRTMQCRLCINLQWSLLVSVCVEAWRGWRWGRSRFLNSVCKDDSALFSRFLYDIHWHSTTSEPRYSTVNTQPSCPSGLLKSTSLLKEDGLAIVIQRRHYIVVLLYLYLWLRISMDVSWRWSAQQQGLDPQFLIPNGESFSILLRHVHFWTLDLWQWGKMTKIPFFSIFVEGYRDGIMRWIGFFLTLHEWI